MGKGFNLGNMFDVNGGTFQEAKAKIDAYYGKGFRNVRIPITWTENVTGNRLADDQTGVIDKSNPRLETIKQTIDYALVLPDMYVVINAHHEKSLKEYNRDWVLERLWEEIATIFQDRSYRLIFEFLNEPHKSNGDAMDPADLKNMVGKAYQKVRSIDEKRIVIIGGNQWYAADEVSKVWDSLADVGGGLDKYIMVEFHHYSPWSFCGDNQGDYADEWNDSDLKNPMETMESWANSIGGGMPIYIGEWGVGWESRYNEMHCNNIREWYSRLQEFATSKNQATAVWDDGGWFKIFNGVEFDNNLVDCIVGLCPWEGTDRFNGCN
jgi:hypothetical protein